MIRRPCQDNRKRKRHHRWTRRPSSVSSGVVIVYQGRPLLSNPLRLGGCRHFLCSQGQDGGAQGLHRLPLGLVERARAQGVHQRQQFPARGRVRRALP